MKRRVIHAVIMLLIFIAVLIALRAVDLHGLFKAFHGH